MSPADALPVYPLRHGERIAGDSVALRLDRLLKSGWRARMTATPEVGFFAVMLQIEAYAQNPAGTLPEDDAALAQLAGLGLAVGRWRRLRARGALDGWTPCQVLTADGRTRETRLMHPEVTGIALAACDGPQSRRSDGRAPAPRLAAGPPGVVLDFGPLRGTGGGRLAQHSDELGKTERETDG